MTVAAGIDIGNSTTEVVIGRLRAVGVDVLGAGRAPTRRAKGSPESLDGAAALLRRLEREHRVCVQLAVAAPLQAVDIATASLPEPDDATGRLRIVSAGASTAGGRGSGVGRPHRIGDPVTGAGRLVAVVPAGLGYLRALPDLRDLAACGRLAAVVLADDEAVLVANRLDRAIPVVDEVAGDRLDGAHLVAVEVAEAGTPLRRLTDPLRLIDAFGLGGSERGDAARVARRLGDFSNAVVALDRAPAPPGPRPAGGWLEIAGTRLSFAEGYDAIRAGVVGAGTAFALPPGFQPHAVDDLWAVDLSAVADTVLTRVGRARSRAVGLAALQAATPASDPGAALAQRLGIRVEVVESEAHAAWVGAMSTPGAGAAVAIDIGGGTVDAVAPADAVVAAGGGELLTAAVAMLTGTTRAAAEWVKRGPAFRVETPQILLAEDGSRSFLDRPAPADTIGALVVAGPAGLLPFHRSLAPGEWRALRLRLKVELLGANVARALRSLAVAPQTVVTVGGPAGDDEVLSAVARRLPDGVVVGRGNVAGSLGSRYAVAYGLLRGLTR